MGTAFFSGHGEWIPGLLYGFVISVLYFALLCYRVRKASFLPPEEAVTSMRVGWVLRLSWIVAALLISQKIPGLNLFSVLVGIFSFQIVLGSFSIWIVVRDGFRRLFKIS